MDAWTTAIAIAHACRFEQSMQRLLHAAFAVGPPLVAAIAQQWRVRPIIHARLPVADLEIIAQFSQCRGRQRNQARFVELRLSDTQYAGLNVDIIEPQTKQFPQRNPLV